MGTSGCGFSRGGRGFTCRVSSPCAVQDGFCYFSLESVVIPTKPHQPLSVFSRGHLGRKQSEFSAKLIIKMAFLFLHYDESKDAVFVYLFDGV